MWYPILGSPRKVILASVVTPPVSRFNCSYIELTIKKQASYSGFSKKNTFTLVKPRGALQGATLGDVGVPIGPGATFKLTGFGAITPFDTARSLKSI